MLKERSNVDDETNVVEGSTPGYNVTSAAEETSASEEAPTTASSSLEATSTTSTSSLMNIESCAVSCDTDVSTSSHLNNIDEAGIVLPRKISNSFCSGSAENLSNTMKKSATSPTTSLKGSKTSIDDFEILRLLGKGAYGKVYQVRKTAGPNAGQIFAMKAINKSSIKSSATDLRHTRSERDVLVDVDHPFIVHLHYAFSTQRRLYLVQEFCNGGELFRRMEVERMMTEDTAKFYLAEIVCALEYLHSHDIVYRDLKTENVMLDAEGHVRLIDFGLSKMKMGPGVTTTTFCGTVEYMAPEVVSKGTGYSKPSDWWSYGVFAFDLLTGRSPFYSNRGKAETKQKILHGKLSLPVYVTRDAQDLIKKLLRRPVSRRLGTTEGAVEIKSHGFFREIVWSDVLQRKLKPPFVPNVNGADDVSNFDERFTSKPVSRESEEKVELAATNIVDETPLPSTSTDETDNSLFADFDYISPAMLAAHLEVPSIQDLRIRGYGNL